MSRRNVTIEAVFAKIGRQKPFKDVAEADWFSEDVDTMTIRSVR